MSAGGLNMGTREVFESIDGVEDGMRDAFLEVFSLVLRSWLGIECDEEMDDVTEDVERGLDQPSSLDDGRVESDDADGEMVGWGYISSSNSWEASHTVFLPTTWTKETLDFS